MGKRNYRSSNLRRTCINEVEYGDIADTMLTLPDREREDILSGFSEMCKEIMDTVRDAEDYMKKDNDITNDRNMNALFSALKGAVADLHDYVENEILYSLGER